MTSMIDVPEELREYMFRHGKKYVPALLHPELERGRIGLCFDTCIKNALYTKEKFKYVEGIGFHPQLKIWILHAWLTDGVHAFDPTWRAFDKQKNDIVIPTQYIGIELPLKGVATFMVKTEYQGVIANAWMAPKLANAIMPAPLPLEALRKTYEGTTST